LLKIKIGYQFSKTVPGTVSWPLDTTGKTFFSRGKKKSWTTLSYRKKEKTVPLYFVNDVFRVDINTKKASFTTGKSNSQCADNCSNEIANF
jgi:hypothetical protein